MAALGSSRSCSSLKPPASASDAAGSPGLAKSVRGCSVIKGGVTVSGSMTRGAAGALVRAPGTTGPASGRAITIALKTSSAPAALLHRGKCFDMLNNSSLTQCAKHVKY